VSRLLSRESAVKVYECLVRPDDDIEAELSNREKFFLTIARANWSAISFEQIQAELRGKDLMCWCPLDQRCHADILLEIANS